MNQGEKTLIVNAVLAAMGEEPIGIEVIFMRLEGSHRISFHDLRETLATLKVQGLVREVKVGANRSHWARLDR
jgi:Fe2+ or Zn2+ uptake regulation protein